MDCSWLMGYDCNEDAGSESDPEQTQDELESRLYSIIHHSDLSQPLPPDLAKHYSIECGEDGKLTVALNNSLENLKSEEIKVVEQLANDSGCDNDVAQRAEDDHSSEKDEIVVISDDRLTTGQSSFKRFRYSDVNIDALDVSTEKITTSFNRERGTYDSVYSNIDFSDLNYFKVPKKFFRRKDMRQLKHVVIPNSFKTDKPPDWKDSANESFISVGANKPGSRNCIIDQMFCALKNANPNENRKGKLYYIARALYAYNVKKITKPNTSRQSSSNLSNGTLNFSCEEAGLIGKSKNTFTKQSEVLSSETTNNFDGSLSLNISPFKPVPPTVDLISEDENDVSEKHSITPKQKWRSLPKCELPTKWSKKMIKFYTKPSQTKMDTELEDIFENLKRNSTIDDWKLDPRDERGYYLQSTTKGKYKNRRCPNCNQRGHLMHECPSPRKVATCYLCGLNYHTAYSCPNKICQKCGVYITSESQECNVCYYNTFNYDTPCNICGQVNHRTDICPDLWRSFHATVEGEKKVPKKIVENKRKYCCNCANKGHFSHQCPFPSYAGDSLSSFVQNYSASSFENGSTEIEIPKHLSHILEDDDANRFLQNLSNSTNAVINMIDEGPIKLVLQISGTFAQCNQVRDQVQGYINTKKRKRMEPGVYHHIKKRRRRFR